MDCKDHLISSDISTSRNLTDSPVRINKIQNFTVKNCRLQTLNPARGRYGSPIAVIESSNGILTNTEFGATLVSVYKSSNILFSNSHFNSTVQLGDSQNITIKNNSFKTPTGYYDAPGIIVANNDVGDAYLDNDMGGGWDGNPSTQGGSADDGIVLGNSLETKIINNNIYNVWDCGVENTQKMENATISNNRITNAKVCGIGGWYGNSWKNNIVSGNLVDKSGKLMLIYRPDRMINGEQFVYFKDNKFINNKFTNPLYQNTTAGQIDFENFGNSGSGTEIIASKVITSNNYFQNNDFNSQLKAPDLSPASAFVDGGGNVCGALSSVNTSVPIKCGSSGQQAVLDPNTELTRAQVAQKLYDKFQIGDWKPVSATAAFTDVDAYSPAFAAVNALYANGITNGCSYINTIRKFCPVDKINRWQFSTFLIKSAKINTEDVPKEPYFKDVPASHPGFAFVQKMRQLGITNGCKINYDASGVEISREFCPDMSMTEYQAGVLINNAYNAKPK